MKKKIPQLGKTEHDLDPFALTIGTSFKFSKKKMRQLFLLFRTRNFSRDDLILRINTICMGEILRRKEYAKTIFINFHCG